MHPTQNRFPRIRRLVGDLRKDYAKVTEPKVKALLAISLELLTDLAKAFDDSEKKVMG